MATMMMMTMMTTMAPRQCQDRGVMGADTAAWVAARRSHTAEARRGRGREGLVLGHGHGHGRIGPRSNTNVASLPATVDAELGSLHALNTTDGESAVGFLSRSRPILSSLGKESWLLHQFHRAGVRSKGEYLRSIRLQKSIQDRIRE